MHGIHGIKTHFMFTNFSENHVIYKIMLKNVVETEATNGNMVVHCMLD
jgi:hypothetical protein